VSFLALVSKAELQETEGTRGTQKANGSLGKLVLPLRRRVPFWLYALGFVDEREFVVLFQLVAKGKVAGLGKKSLFGSSAQVCAFARCLFCVVVLSKTSTRIPFLLSCFQSFSLSLSLSVSRAHTFSGVLAPKAASLCVSRAVLVVFGFLTPPPHPLPFFSLRQLSKSR
jgi:hypothetical protein